MEGEDCANIHDCNAVHFCDPSTKKCQKCSDTNCFACLAADFCANCNKDYFADLAGKCTKDCNPGVVDDQYCFNNTPTTCKEGQLSACRCGGKLNCASCTTDKMSCSKCLTGFALKNGECEFCESGIDQTIGIQCLGKQCSNGCDTCTVANGCVSCKSGYEVDGTGCKSVCPVCKEAEFCDVTSKICKPCNNDCKSCDIENKCTGCYTGLDLNGFNCEVSSSKLSGGAIAGIVIAVLVVVGGVGGVAGWFLFKKYKR